MSWHVDGWSTEKHNEHHSETTLFFVRIHLGIFETHVQLRISKSSFPCGQVLLQSERHSTLSTMFRKEASDEIVYVVFVYALGGTTFL